MTNIIHKVNSHLIKYYKEIFSDYQATPKGVGWLDQESANIRYSQMLEVINNKYSNKITPTLLDVGCGYGGLLDFIKSSSFSIQYTGIDINNNIIRYCKEKHKDANFILSDIFNYNEVNNYDYVVCNGILTMKRDLLLSEMNEFSHQLIKKMFSLCKRGIAFNIHSSYVNFFDKEHHYKSPVEMFAYCLENYTTKVKIDHSYPLYEYTVYLYKHDN